MTWLRDTLNNKGARAKCLKWAYFALATSLHVLAKVTSSTVKFKHYVTWILKYSYSLFGMYTIKGLNSV